MRGRPEASGDRSVAAGGDIGKVVTGDGVTFVENGVLLPAESLSVPDTRLVHLPERTTLFVGRTEELSRLDAGAPSGVQVLCGLGGIGKSTLAAHWAAGRLDDHDPVWWITAETAGELDAGLAALARAMQPAYVGVLPDDALRERALQWLSAHDDWLLILDNVSDPADVKPLLARATGGRVLITTRRATGWQDLAETIAVPELDPAEAAALFTRVCPGDGVPEVCAELGHLPLALRQAAAYCAEAGITPRAYLDLLARYPAETYALTAEGGEAGRTVARVWQVTLDRLGDTPLAGRILSILAWWAPEGIPRRLLEPLGSPVEVTEAVRRLRAHSMISLDGESIGVHRLVQAVVRAGGGGREEARGLLARAASGVQGNISATLNVCLPYATQVASLAQHTEPDEDTGDWCMLFHWAGMVLGMTTDRRALLLFARALLGYTRLYGEESELSRQAMGGLVLQQQLDGSPELAGLPKEYFELNIRLYGPDDARTIEARAQLAKALLPSDPRRAEELLRENVDRAARSLGEDAPETLGARRALLGADPDPLSACAGLEALLARAREVLPEDTALIDSIERSLVGNLLDLGRTDRALALTEAGVAGARTRFGLTHPNTLVRRGFHVFVLTEAGELDRARRLVRDLLDDCESTLGGTLLTMMVRQLAREQLSLND
ncbi:tetratricopeptide repeat protein [Streptomyces sp. NPDC004284]|uniref:tetratricopeptide repeat protein n=1 Tax=Streptomyces sp. NPDC004284 TaxID=3364695 RepID=UPI0036C2E8F9